MTHTYKMKINLTFLALLCFMLAQAQDPIFTQYFMAPQALNPGYTGFMETTHVGLLHRTQWPDADLKINSDYAFINAWSEDMNSGFGLSFLSQRESFTNYNLNQANASYAYKVQLESDWYFIPGIEVGFGTKSYGFQNLILEDQLNIGTGTIDGTSIDPVGVRDKINFFDVSAGMVVHNDNAFVGVALKHLNKPNISFTNIGNIPLDMFLSVNAGYEFMVSDYNDFLPNNTKLLFTSSFMMQGDYNRLDVGTGLIFSRFFFGAIAATNPSRNNPNSHLLTSINGFGGLQYEHFKFGYSYDFNVSGIGRTGGIHEFSLTYHFDLAAKCFGCPQYE